MSVLEEIASGRGVKVRRLADAAGVSASGLYGLIARGEIPARRIGKRIIVPPEVAAELLGLKTPTTA